MPGPKPKPTHLKLIRGNPGKRPLNNREPKPVGDLKDAPANFNDDLRDIWNYAIEHAPAGLLKKIDSAILEAWCNAQRLHRLASTELRRTGVLIRTPNAEIPVQSPWVAILNKQALIMMRATDHLGFSPATRSRIVTGDVPAGGFGAWDSITG